MRIGDNGQRILKGCLNGNPTGFKPTALTLQQGELDRSLVASSSLKSLCQRILFLLLLSIGGLAQAQDMIVSRALLVDPAGDLSIQEVAQMPFLPIGEVLTRGYTADVSWLKLVVSPTEQPLVLRIRPTYLDLVTLYWRDQDSPIGWREMQTGDTIPLSERPLPYVSLAFPIDSENVSTYYLRLQTTSTSLLNVQALTTLNAQRSEVLEQGLQVLYYGFMLWMLLWAITDFVIYRQKVVGAFIAMQVVQILYNLSVTGYWALLFPHATFGDRLLSTFVVLVMPVSLFFHRTLFKLYEPSRVALKLLEALIFFGAALVVWTFVGPVQTALHFNALILLSLPALFLWLAFTAKQSALPGIAALRTLYVLLSVLILTVLLPVLGVSESIEMYLGAATLQGLIGASLMTLFLFLRSKRLQQESMQARIALERYEQQLLGQKNRFEEQARFMDMLTHELKTPVSVIRITTDMLRIPDAQRERINRSVHTISTVIDRCRLSIQAEHQQMLPRVRTINLMQSINDMCQGNLEPKRIELSGTVRDEWFTDEQLLKVVLYNLVDNALKYSPMGSSVSVVVSERPGVSGKSPVADIVVCNELTSVARPEAEKIFEKYYRGAGSSGQSGTGLGLYLAREIGSLLGAELTCSVQAQKICFTLSLPQHFSKPA